MRTVKSSNDSIRLICFLTMNNNNVIDIANASGQLETLSEEDRRALRRSRFSSLAPAASSPKPEKPQSSPRVAHPGGPVATNKAVALAKFLQRKLQEPSGSASLDPDLVERAVEDAKSSLHADENSKSTKRIRHVDSFSEGIEETQVLELDKPDLGPDKAFKPKKKKNKKKKQKNF